MDRHSNLNYRLCLPKFAQKYFFVNGDDIMKVHIQVGNHEIKHYFSKKGEQN